MELTLEPNEAAMLKDVLSRFLSDLRVEIGSTEDRDARRELHEQEDMIRKVIQQIDQKS